MVGASLRMGREYQESALEKARARLMNRLDWENRETVKGGCATSQGPSKPLAFIPFRPQSSDQHSPVAPLHRLQPSTSHRTSEHLPTPYRPALQTALSAL